jgi:hypothetical protein
MHDDYLDNSANDNYDYDTAGVGGNRFATILLYFRDLDETDGGETLFQHAWPPGMTEETGVPLEQALANLRESGDTENILKTGSWEEEMTAYCRSRLAIRPRKLRAVLFYSQFPNGQQDHSVLHGGCPVLNNATKWAANLWVWSAAMGDWPLAPKLWEEEEKEPPVSISAMFRNTGTNPEFDEAKLWYADEMFFGDLGPTDPPVAANTFVSHKWNVKVGDLVVKSFVISDEETQEFEI